MDGELGPRRQRRARARATIDRDALRHNLRSLRERAPGRAVVGVVKADAYGHGAPEVAATLAAAGCERFAVVSVDELEELRSAGISRPVLLLGPLATASEARAALEGAATPVLHDDAGLALLCEALRARDGASSAPCAVHVEIDTGMRRMGVPVERATGFVERVAAAPELVLEGLFTHFACADAPDLDSALEQSARFRELLRALGSRGIAPPLVHASNSAGVLAGDALRAALPEETAIRPGLALYGVRPAPHLGALWCPR